MRLFEDWNVNFALNIYW